MWLIVSESCYECGRDQACKLQTTKPVDADVKKVEESIGGLSCINSFVIEIKPDGDIERVEDYC